MINLFFNFRSFGCSAHVYEHANYQGCSLVIRHQNADFHNDFFDTQVGSMIVRGNCRWLFYEHPNFLGSSHLITSPYYASAPNWGGSGDRLSSARPLPLAGVKAIVLFEHYDYTGRILTLYSSFNYLRLLYFDDIASSIIVIGGTWKIYERPDYQGLSQTLSLSEYPNGFDIGDNTLNSVQLLD